MTLGYARVSTLEQDLDTQLASLKEAGCKKIFREKISGAAGSKRPALAQLQETLRPGDTLVVWKLDRLGRSMKELLHIVEELAKNKVHFKSIHEQIDTTTPTGKLTFHIFASLAQFEREVNSFRTKEALAQLKKNGVKLGRPQGLSEEAQKKAHTASALYKGDQFSVEEICQHIGIKRPTLYKYLKYTGTPKKRELKAASIISSEAI